MHTPSSNNEFLKRKHNQENEDDLITLQELDNASEAKRAQYLSYTDRYFTRYYKLDVKYKLNDHLVLMHSNKVAVCCVAPTHPLLDTSKYRVKSVQFIQTVNKEMSGKHKHNANNLNYLQSMCKIYCNKVDANGQETDEESYFILYSCMNAKLLEINERLLEHPNLVQSKPGTEGYLAILMPKLDNLSQQLSELISHDEYTKLVAERNASNS